MNVAQVEAIMLVDIQIRVGLMYNETDVGTSRLRAITE
jgi:hypothetical protein